MNRVTIIITDEPIEAALLALSLRRFLLQSTDARFVYDDNGEGSKAEPRRLTAEFAESRHKTPAG